MTGASFEIFKNPLAEPTYDTKIADPCIMVIFGATGDLTARKLIPALYNLDRDGQLPTHFACIGFARRDKDDAIFRSEMKQSINKYSRQRLQSEDTWNKFAEMLYYHKSSFDSDEGYESLARTLHEFDQKLGTRGNRIYYLSTPPKHFPIIIKKLSEHGLIYDPQEETRKWSRVIIEKPFGHDLPSAEALHKELSLSLDESQIYRIDHYLGKETVQNLMVLRFSNPFFESMWNNQHIDNIQISVAEELGIGTRGHFFEEAGILRDIVQNHMMQLLSLVAMEPPTNLDADSIRDEKVKVMQSLRPFPEGLFDQYAVRGQYGKGYINGEDVPGYREEADVDKNSSVETYVALKVFVDNWRFSGVPFYLRAGKRLPKRATEIAITFKKVPGALFCGPERKIDENVLVIRIQPDEGISLKMNCKVPGLSNIIQPVKMDFRYGTFFGATPPEAYERLLCDCMSGDSTLFARYDEVLASWKLLTPLINHWKEKPPTDFPNYPAGSWGPLFAQQIFAKDGRGFRLL